MSVADHLGTTSRLRSAVSRPQNLPSALVTSRYAAPAHEFKRSGLGPQCVFFSQTNSFSCLFFCFFSPSFDLQLLGDISIVATNPAVPFGLRRRKLLPVGWQETDFQTLLPTLELWAQQLCLLKVKTPLSHTLLTLFRQNNFVCVFSFEDLKKGLNKLSSRLMPWQPPHEDGGAAKVEDMMLLVDSMLENTETDDGKVVLLLFSWAVALLNSI